MAELMKTELNRTKKNWMDLIMFRPSNSEIIEEVEKPAKN